MVASRKIYDFCDSHGGSEAPLPARSGERRQDFFIDGWDAYERWLNDVRHRVDGADDRPG